MRPVPTDAQRATPSIALHLLAAIVIGSAAAACAAPTPSNALPPCQPNSPVACTIIDGYPVGALVRDCGADAAACGDVGLLARLALDAREPDHLPPTSVQQFEPDMARVCGALLCAFSSQPSIVVFTFADGSYQATGYECQGVSPCVGTLTWHGWANAIQNPSP